MILLRKLTDEEKKEIIDGCDHEGFGYYFTGYTYKWSEIPSEIQELAKAILELNEMIEEWKEELQYGEDYYED